MNRNALPPILDLPLSLPLSLVAMLGLTSLTASAAGFYRFDQWSAPAWGTPGQTPNTSTYYWYQPLQTLPGNYDGYQPLPYQTGNYYYWYQPLQPLTVTPPSQTFYWYQFGQPQPPQALAPGLSPQSLQAPYYWYWFQPYY